MKFTFLTSECEFCGVVRLTIMTINMYSWPSALSCIMSWHRIALKVAAKGTNFVQSESSQLCLNRPETEWTLRCILYFIAFKGMNLLFDFIHDQCHD